MSQAIMDPISEKSTIVLESHFDFQLKCQPSVLIPTLPMSSRRYDPMIKRNSPGNMVIPAGLFSYAKESNPPYLPKGWSAHVQPEGQVYFVCDMKPHVVTDAYMYTEAVKENVLRFLSIICATLEAKNVSLPDSAELYLNPSETEDSCLYYFVDHASHAVFWLDDIEVHQLEMWEVISESHLSFVLMEQYWTHVEQFPSHRIGSLYLAIDELIATFVHGQGDQMTSTGSTFAYTAKQAKDYVRILQNAKENLSYAPSVCIVARLWGVISRVRHQTFYAQERARLDRAQTVVSVGEAETGRVFEVANRLLFNLPAARVKELESLWVDNLVYVHVWADFVQSNREEWRQHLTWTLGMAIIDLLLLLVPGTSGILSLLSLVCCAIGVTAALALFARFHGINTREPNHAVEYLDAAKTANYVREALVLSLPRAMLYYAVALASAQTLAWIENQTNVYVLSAIVLCILFASIPWRRGYESAMGRFRRWFRRRRSYVEDADVLNNV